MARAALNPGQLGYNSAAASNSPSLALPTAYGSTGISATTIALRSSPPRRRGGLLVPIFPDPLPARVVSDVA